MSNYDEQLFVNQEKKFRGLQKLLQPATRQSVMLIEAPQDMGKTWLVDRIQRYCQQADPAIPVAKIDFRNPLQLHEIQDCLGLVRFIRDKVEHGHYFSSLNTTISNFTETGSSNQAGLALLRQNIETYFDLDQNLVFDMGIRYENLIGQSLAAKSRELVNYCQRHDSLHDLVEHCSELRPRVDWWQELEAYQARAASAVDDDSVPATSIDNHAPIWADTEIERTRAERQINTAFFECLQKLLADKGQVALLFDSYETVTPVVERWLLDELLPRVRDGQFNKINVILSGRKTPDLTDLDMKHLLVQTGLDTFTEEDVREYLEDRRSIEGLDLRTVLLTSGGIPGALAMMADHALATVDAEDDFFSDL